MSIKINKKPDSNNYKKKIKRKKDTKKLRDDRIMNARDIQEKVKVKLKKVKK